MIAEREPNVVRTSTQCLYATSLPGVRLGRSLWLRGYGLYASPDEGSKGNVSMRVSGSKVYPTELTIQSRLHGLSIYL
jgi:hypothetical protein